MKIILKTDWDIPVQPPDSKDAGHFIGREKEVSFLSNEIMRKRQGAILVSGHRGVGKTSLVYKSLRSIKSQNILPVVINATHLEPEEPDAEILKEVHYAKQILVNLIRRLYSASKYAKEEGNLDFKNTYTKIERLYKKAVAHKYEALGQTSKAEEYKDEKLSNFEINFSADLISGIVWLMGFSLSAASIVSSMPIWLKVLLSLLFSSPIPLLVNKLIINRRFASSKIFSAKSTAEELYTIDNNVGILAYDLEEVHRELASHEIKVVYVVDEMDKLEEISTSNKSEKAPTYVRIFKHFKNFFNLSSAIFVFIGGEEVHSYFENVAKSQVTSKRPNEYTYFVSKYFLSRPTSEDLGKFLDKIVENSNSLINTKEVNKFESFKYLLIFNARGDYFDLLQQIKDRVTYFEKGFPVIDLTKLSEIETVQVDLQKSLSVVFEKYVTHIPSRWSENEVILRQLYTTAYQLLDTGVTEYGDSNTKDLAGLSKRELLSFLHRLGALGNPVVENSINGDNKRIAKIKYSFTGTFKSSVPSSYNSLTTLEEDFIEKMDVLLINVIKLYNFFANLRSEKLVSVSDGRILSLENIRTYVNKVYKWGIRNPNVDIWTPYSLMKNSDPPFRYNRDEIEDFSQKATQILDGFGENFIMVVSNILKEVFSDSGAQVSDLKRNKDLFMNVDEDLRENLKKITHLVLFANEKYVLLIANGSVNNYKELKESLLRKNEDKYRILFLSNEVINKVEKGVLHISIDHIDKVSIDRLMEFRDWFSPFKYET